MRRTVSLTAGLLLVAASSLGCTVVNTGEHSGNHPVQTPAPTAMATTTSTTTVTETAPLTANPAAGRDLGLQRPLVVPRCDGRVVVFVESIPITAPDARERVRKWIEPWEFGPLGAADYLYSQAACRSIRSVDDNGQPFYAVFLAPTGDVCAKFARLRSSLPSGAYPRMLSASIDPGYNPCAR